MRRLILAAALVLAIAPCSMDDSAPPPPSAGPTTVPVATTDPPAPPSDGESVAVSAVIDGDSIAVERNGWRTEVRIAGINAPEADECHGEVSREMLEGLIGADAVTLLPVRGENDTDQFGRLLRDVYVGGTYLNEELVRRGAALAIQTGSPGEDALVAAEDEAWADGAGMWAPDACGPFPSGVEITEVSYDPPGRDGENAAEEFLLLRNESAEPVDIGGWVVRDESSRHRYRFPEDTSLTPGEGVRLRSGCGTDEGLDRYWCADDAVWSNGGDTALLQTATGTVASRYKYAGSS